ncbi:unnamed protein product [Linum tenue]|uniref:Uncharacterized protein n=1 Tax=Linum tenue TaxID=586396 RepID=A0AAV0LKK0_9ROSI|nr:unnamed protein product [Linum tenue]
MQVGLIKANLPISPHCQSNSAPVGCLLPQKWSLKPAPIPQHKCQLLRLQLDSTIKPRGFKWRKGDPQSQNWKRRKTKPTLGQPQLSFPLERT